jgi:F420-non-reducing hydrogenase small subunit
MAVKVAFMQSSDCWGCHQSLLNAHLGLLPVLPALDIVYWPAVVDFKHSSLKARPDGDILVGFVEGSLRTKEDVENVKLMRAKCQIIISFGSCSCYGNVHGLANQWKKEKLVKRKFYEVESIADESGKEPTKHVPGFTDKLVPTDAVIRIDAYISGCPPKPEAIISAVQFLLGQKPFPMKENAFCKDCILNNQNCLLEKGTLCFGPITSTGCTLKCTSQGKPCVGCFGPSKQASPRADKLKSMTTNLSQISSGNKKNLYEFLSLFLNVPLMAGFDLSADILMQVKKKGTSQTPLANLTPAAQQIATNALGYIKDHRDFHEISNVCDTCPRIRGRLKMTEIKRDYMGLPNQEDCFIEQGYICVGPITRAGCGGLCIRVNAPCTGCFGQNAWNVDQPSRFADTIIKNFNVGLSKEQILTQVKDKLGTFEKFTLASNKTYKGGE